MSQPGGVVLLDLSPTALTVLKRAAALLALAAVALSSLGSRYAWLDYKPGGAAFDVEIRPIFTGVFVVALLVALRWEIAGAILAALAGGAIVAFAVNQLVATHAAAVIAAFAVPALLWALVDLNELSRNTALIGIALVGVAAVGGFFVGNATYDAIWGPTHPESAVDPLPDSAVEWVWTGSVTSTEAEVRIRPRNDFEQVRLLVSSNEDLSAPGFIGPRDAGGRVLGFEIEDLEPATEYFYAVELDGELDLIRSGRFRTYPEGAASFQFAVGSCARVGSNGAVFDRIREVDPLLYLVTGDLHYGDNGRDDVERFQEVMDLTLALPAQSALYRSTSIAYMWDDHDYGGNDSDGLSPSRRSAMAAYREYVPSYDLSGDESAVYQAFTIGRVRFVLTDARSARNVDRDGPPSMLGREQKAWLKQELVSATSSHELVIWVNPVPWVAEAEEGADHWGGFAEERAELANHIADNGVYNLLMISGDAHMVAIDDGTNTNYSDTPGRSFPLLHAAPLDRPGSIKGGPYSEGAIGESGQFAVVDVADDGEHIEVTMQARDWQGNVVLEHTFATA